MRLRGLWMLIVGVGLVLSLGGRGHAAEPMREFLDGLRARQYYDWAMLYLEQLQDRSDLPAELHDSLQELADLCDERRQFNTQLRLHRWLHWWLILHIPPLIALLVLFVAHVIVSLRVVPFGK